MPITQRWPSLSMVLALGSLFAFGVHAYLLFQSGCAGDIKLGLGDPLRALDLEAKATLALWAALALGASAFGTCKGLDADHRYGGALAFLVVAWLGSWFGGLELVSRGVQACLGT